MSAEAVVLALNSLRLGLSVLAANRDGGPTAALDVLTSGNLASFGLTGEILRVTQLARAGLTYLNGRGVIVDDAVALIQAAEDEGRDVTTEEVQEHLNLTQTELDETQAAIDAMDD